MAGRVGTSGGKASLPIPADAATVEANDDGGVRVRSTDAASTPLMVRGASAQSAPLLEWQDDAGAVVAALSPSGELVIQNLKGSDGDGLILKASNGNVRMQANSLGLSFFGAAPVSQRSTISDPSGGVTSDTAARTAINQILDLLQAYGLMA